MGRRRDSRFRRDIPPRRDVLDAERGRERGRGADMDLRPNMGRRYDIVVEERPSVRYYYGQPPPRPTSFGRQQYSSSSPGPPRAHLFPSQRQLGASLFSPRPTYSSRPQPTQPLYTSPRTVSDEEDDDDSDDDEDEDDDEDDDDGYYLICTHHNPSREARSRPHFTTQRPLRSTSFPSSAYEEPEDDSEDSSREQNELNRSNAEAPRVPASARPAYWAAYLLY